MLTVCEGRYSYVEKDNILTQEAEKLKKLKSERELDADVLQVTVSDY